MNDQEMAFLNMSQDLVKSSKNNGDGQNAFYMFLKYSPDSLVKLFDLCVVKPCYEQVIVMPQYSQDGLLIETSWQFRSKAESTLTFFCSFLISAVPMHLNFI